MFVRSFMLHHVDMTSTSDAVATSALSPSIGPFVAPSRRTALTTAAEPAVMVRSKTKAAPTRFMAEAVDALSQHFAATSWPLNKALSQDTLIKELAAIQHEYRFAKFQVARQLKNFKDKTYRLNDIILLQSPEQIKEVFEEGIGMECSEFVCSAAVGHSVQHSLPRRPLSGLLDTCARGVGQSRSSRQSPTPSPSPFSVNLA